MTFETIKQAALNKDIEALNAIIAQPGMALSIDVGKVGYGNDQLTAAEELAREGNVEAVEFLKAHGASVLHIAQGFAFGGYVDQVDRYRTQFAAGANQIALGFALGGHMDHVNRYHHEFPSSIDWLARGFAHRGDIALADRYHTEFGANPEGIAYGFALGGYTEEADRYRVRFGVSSSGIARGFALGGHAADADRYRIHFNAQVNDIASGFAQGGHTEHADRYRRLFHACPEHIAFAFASGGHTADAERYRIRFGASVGSIFLGFHIGNHKAVLARYIAMHANHSPVNAEILLSDYVNTFTDRPIALIENFEYPEKFCCPILQGPPLIPVRIMGFGPFDYHSIMKIGETSPGSGKRLLPVLQNQTFERRDIAPDTVTREALNHLAETFSRSNAVTSSAQVSFTRNVDRGGLKNTRRNSF